LLLLLLLLLLLALGEDAEYKDDNEGDMTIGDISSCANRGSCLAPRCLADDDDDDDDVVVDVVVVVDNVGRAFPAAADSRASEKEVRLEL